MNMGGDTYSTSMGFGRAQASYPIRFQRSCLKCNSGAKHVGLSASIPVHSVTNDHLNGTCINIRWGSLDTCGSLVCFYHFFCIECKAP